MGLTFVEVEIENPAVSEVSESIRLLVDSGAIHSVVPAPVLKGLRIEPKGRQEFRFADGSTVARSKGVALFRYEERFGGADVIFGEESDASLLGATTLEALGLALDSLKRELRPLPMVL